MGAAVIEADSNPAVEDRAVDTEDEPEVTKQVWSLTHYSILIIGAGILFLQFRKQLMEKKSKCFGLLP